MMKAVKAVWRALKNTGEIAIQGEFLWPAPNSRVVEIRQPDPEDPESRRTIDEIPPEEIGKAMLNLVQDGLSVQRDKLFTLVARVLGFERKGPQIQERLDGILEDLIHDEKLIVVDDRVSFSG